MPALLTIAVGVLLATQDGGFGGADWYPAALFLLALLALTLSVAPPARPQWPRPLTRALIALAAFCLWALSSALWSDVPGAAWDGANRAVLYGIVLALVTLRRWAVRDYALALGLVAGGIGTLAIGVLVECAVRAHPAALFIASRLIEPVGYTNATANLWLIGLWPALALACRHRLHWVSRAVSLGIACVLLETSMLSVSRGAVVSIAVTAVVLLTVAGARWKVALGLLALGGAAALAAGPLLAVSAATTVAELERALPPALAAIAWTSALVACLGAAAIALGRRAESAMAPDLRLAWRTRMERLMALLGAVAVVVALVAIGNPATWTVDRWHDFKTSGYTQVRTGPGRLTGSLGSGRYDYYRVALNEFRKRPLAGVGYESFQEAYLAERRTDETPRFPHSLAFGVLSQLGLVGVALLLAFLSQALVMVRRALRAAGEERLLVAGALAGFAVWFVHGLVDWLWEFPALGILAFSLLGLAMRGCAATAEPELPEQPSRRGLLAWSFARHRAIHGRALRGAAAIAAAVVALSFATLGIAARHTQAGFDDAVRDPAGALAQLEQASRLDILSAAPLLTRGVIAQGVGNRQVAEASFRGALAREPRNWFANLELGVVWASKGRRAAALDLLGRAARLNPRETLIAGARRRVARGQTVMPGEIERALFADQRKRLRSVMP